MSAPHQKLYAYVDESGQDTRGRLFVVAVVLMQHDHEQTRQMLERIEYVSGKQQRKWVKSTPRQRVAYMEQVLQLSALRTGLFYAHFPETTAYFPCLLDTIARALTTTVEQRPRQEEAVEATILIDGLHKTLRQQVVATLRAQLRPQRVRIAKARGLHEHSDALMRLADAIAGFVRHGMEGRPPLDTLLSNAERQGIVRRV